MIKNTLKYLKTIIPRYIDLRVLKNIQSKFSTIGNLWLRDEQSRKENVVAHRLTGFGKDINPMVVRP